MRVAETLRAVLDLTSFGYSELLIDVVMKRARGAIETEARKAPSVLLVGLGNPGPQYEHTRHNAGRLLIERLVASQPAMFTEWSTLDGARMSFGKLGGVDVCAALPLSFMNVSGRPVQRLCARWSVKPDAVLIAHDDIDLAVGRCKIKAGGSTGGHRGLDSCAACLHDAAFWRLRIGVGRPLFAGDVPEFVLDTIPEADMAVLGTLFDKLATHSEQLPQALTDEAVRSRLLNDLSRLDTAVSRKTLKPRGESSVAADCGGHTGGGGHTGSGSHTGGGSGGDDKVDGFDSGTVDGPSTATISIDGPSAVAIPCSAEEGADEVPAAKKQQSFGASSLAEALPTGSHEAERSKDAA